MYIAHSCHPVTKFTVYIVVMVVHSYLECCARGTTVTQYIEAH